MSREVERSIRRLNRLIAKEWRHVEPELKRCVKRGEYERERWLRARTAERVRELTEQWREWRLSKPPFVTKEKWYYVRHPVTPENFHLLQPQC